MSENNLFRIGITHGDYNGIGYEVIMKALNDPKMLELCSPVVYGAAKAASFYKSLFNLQDFSMQVCRKVEQINKNKNYLVNIFEQEGKVEPGTPSKEAGRLSELALTNACKDLKAQLIDCNRSYLQGRHTIRHLPLQWSHRIFRQTIFFSKCHDDDGDRRVSHRLRHQPPADRGSLQGTHYRTDCQEVENLAADLEGGLRVHESHHRGAFAQSPCRRQRADWERGSGDYRTGHTTGFQ